jgi:hypothetical protein
MYYKARWYDSSLGRFSQADTIVPGAGDPRAWDRYAYVENNPIVYNDPTGHCRVGKICPDYDPKKGETDSRLDKLLEYVENNVMNKQDRVKGGQTAISAMVDIMNYAATVYGEDWDGYLSALGYVFNGVYGTGRGFMYNSWKIPRGEFRGYSFGDTGFRQDFSDEDEQVRHFWAAFNNAVDPKGNDEFCSFEAAFGNFGHDLVQDWLGWNDTTVMDYGLSVTGINLTKNVGQNKTISSPYQLAFYISDSIGEYGTGDFYSVPSSSYWLWRSPTERRN